MPEGRGRSYQVSPRTVERPGGLLQTQPTSLAGLRAFFDHIDGPLSTGEAGEAFWDEEEMKLAFPTLAAAVRDLIEGRLA
jgi:hypothetical protein